LAKTVSFLGISGTIQAEDGVVHLVAEHLWEPKNELKPALVTLKAIFQKRQTLALTHLKSGSKE
jgi:hypothetical protein